MERKSIYGFEMIKKEEMDKIIEKDRVLIVDLRCVEMYRQGHFRNARNFPFAYIDEWKYEIPEKIPVILYCEHGNQSLLAARKLSGRKGAVYTVVGGYQSIKEAR